nr:TspO/MBR family protein [Anaerobacterium chartisolvens]
MGVFKVDGKFSLKKLIASILISEGVGIASSVFSMGSAGIYKKLAQPWFAPPAWIFPPVWGLLFLLIGIAAYRIWMLGTDRKDVRNALLYYGIQLIFNFLWPIIFFTAGLRGLAFVEIIILLAAIIITTIKFFKLDKTAGYLMLPYVLWVAFASILNYSLWQLNR